ncbi:prephenate dehydratase [Actinomycetospora callitridis]|uniref:prephenate dehydratase n=1 Tax=Actinomycetospora callitridis TaxID=913944 RepID=UPI002365D4A7|nr:prephenate dehydratase [Actinomycetospora callitridis]MDD7920516.1 prephenate dehydratase [Actinomycetospora callitridis]
MRVAFLGPHGTFCEQALRTLTPADLDAALGDAEPSEHPLSSTTAVLDAVRRGDADAACVPVENSVEGGVPATMDGLVEQPPLVIVREILLRVEFAVLVRPGTTAADVTSVASHPHGEAQTRRWIAEHLPGAEVRLTGSTAAAAAQVAAGEVDAAVCAPVAAAHHGLEALATGVHDSGDAVTRFVLVRPPGPPGLPTPTGDDRTSIAATTVNRPGALLAVLTEIAMRGVDLTRIESRPLQDRRGDYWFFLDGSGHVADPAMGEALAALRRRCTDVRFLGSYPRARLDGPRGDAVSGPGEQEPGQTLKDHTEAASWVAALRDGTGA